MFISKVYNEAGGEEASMDDKILPHLCYLYGERLGRETRQRLQNLMERYGTRHDRERRWRPDESDAILITYPDQVRESDHKPLRTLYDFLVRHIMGVVSGVHLLPFYPWSSDDGFSVKDYRAVDPAYGGWGDIEQFSQHFHLMFDAVINHASVESNWFQGFLRDDPKYRNYFIAVKGHPDLTTVVRPRTVPVLTTFKTKSGEKAVWTTFSADQVDLNYKNPEVLLEIVDILLSYIARGANLIRLDAVAYIWKEIGTGCIHLPQTYRIIQLFRAILNEMAPDVLLVTETNVSQPENTSYFGDGQNSAHLVYNFTLSPMVLYTILSGSTEEINRWLKHLVLPSKEVMFFNFLASHDGIGLDPLRGILSESQIDTLVSEVKSNGGLASYKSNKNGSKSVYELNINYFDALTNPHSKDSVELQVNRFLVAHAIMLAFAGLPGIYFHSLFGSRGWLEGIRQTGRNRTINRQKLTLAELENALTKPNSLRTRVFRGLSRLLKARASSSAFNPYGEQRVLEFNSSVFSLLRFSPNKSERVLCLHNITADPQVVEIQNHELVGPGLHPLRDLIGHQEFKSGRKLTLKLSPYQSLWLA
jgi:glycosidase